ncbi:FtsX-like permease family protein [Thalassobaculum sp. OXR-137]|uniref:cell division protein FtsX n=1 Tax=Thalassobaculum sp. OXR-137 TaxID=3100173 RepID=UPI002AC9AB91|nr:FtsX-like permease family protein [Thalassobaculum sp. OXR-137]WPZ34992.1 FtsX-like permease family protein [Thalassobaculum sp. OXR-137]
MIGHSDLALGRDSSTRFLPALLAVMVYLAALATVGALAARGFVADWDERLSGAATVQIPPVDGLSQQERLDAVLRLLGVTPGIASVEPMPPKQSAALLAPWLGAELAETLPLPLLIDLHLDRGQEVDLASLSARLDNAAPGTTLDDHGRWLAEARALGNSVAIAGTCILVVVLLAAVMAVIFAVRTGLSVHREEIEILNLIGAPDRYIARQFQWHAGRLALIGGIAGALLAVASIVGLQIGIGQWSADPGDVGVTSITALVRIGWVEWLALILLPPVTAAIAMATARVSVQTALARMA